MAGGSSAPCYVRRLAVFYVFLDFDGVTHPTSANGRYFREENIQALEAALDGYDAQIVISSTWRLDIPLSEIKTLLGPKLGEMVVGITPEVDDPFLHNPRQAEAELYLAQDGVEQWPWLAIDDTAAFYQENAPVVLTDSQLGFQLSDVPVFREAVDDLLQSMTRTYLIEHSEEGVVLAMVTNKLMRKDDYIAVLSGEADEKEITVKMASYAALDGKPVIYMFDDD